jgi:hypothetical protein
LAIENLELLRTSRQEHVDKFFDEQQRANEADDICDRQEEQLALLHVQSLRSKMLLEKKLRDMKFELDDANTRLYAATKQLQQKLANN